MVEEATTERPFEFVSGMGLALDAFEAKVMPLGKGETFDFVLSIDEGYGPYVEEGVQRLPRSVFEIDGRIDSRYIFEGAIVPLMNADGERFNATITRITPEEITVDLNHPWRIARLRLPRCRRWWKDSRVAVATARAATAEVVVAAAAVAAASRRTKNVKNRIER